VNDDRLSPEIRRVAVVVVVGAIMSILDTTIVNVALESLARDLNAPLSTIQWVSTGYLLSLATVIPLTGWAAERFGPRLVWMTVVAGFVVTSALCALAWSAESLIAFRVLQGLAGGMIMPIGMITLAQTAGPHRVGRVMSVIGVPMLLAPVLGPVLGGLIGTHLSWRWIFLVNLPIGAAAVALAAKQVNESSDPEHSRLDPLGLVALIGGLFCLILALIEGNQRGWSSGVILGLFAAAAVLLVVFVISQTRDTTTMVDLTLFTRPAFVGAQTTAFTISASMFAMFLYLTLYLQNIIGLSPLQTGLCFLPLSLVSFVAAPIAGRLSTRMPIRILLGAGLALNAIAMWSMSRIDAGSNWPSLIPGFVIGGIGIGMVNAPLASTAVSTVRQERAGMASGINNTFRQLGIATGIAALGAIFASKVEASAFAPHPDAVARASFVAGLHDILLIGAGVAAVGAVLAAVLVRRRDFVASGPQPS